MIIRDNTILIIGGGAAGIAMGKAFTQAGLSFDIIEKEDNFAGNWYFGSKASKVYRSTHLISSKTNSQFSDFPMPDDYPTYPSHTQFLTYLHQVAKHFELYEHTTFNTSVDKLSASQNGWCVELSNGESRWYPDVVVANGVLRDPVFPNIPGQFNGEMMHSATYTDPKVFDDKSVLIIGAGNSGCDIAVDSAQRAKTTLHSTRRGYHYMPKFINGQATQEWLMEIVSQFNSAEDYWQYVKETFKMAGHDGEDYGLTKPDHGLHQAHPIMNSNVLYHIGHGDIIAKPDVKCFDGDEVVFTDDSRAKIDLVLLATGFRPNLPFLDPAELDWKSGIHRFFLNAIPLSHDNIVFVGYFNIPSGFGNIANTCSRFTANYFLAKRRNNESFRVINALKHKRDQIDIGQGQFVDTKRHDYELDLWKYVKTINFLNEQLQQH